MVRCASIVLGAFYLVAAAGVLAQGPGDALKNYATLQANAKSALEKTAPKHISKGEGPDTKFQYVGPCEIPPVSVGNNESVSMGVKIWGELAAKGPGGSRQFVNLTKHKWQRKERFYLWIESAVPVQVGLFQNYPPDSNVPSRIVSPDPRFPSTYETVLPGMPYRFEPMIEMDDNLTDELMSIVVVRSDTQALPVNGSTTVITDVNVQTVVSTANGAANGSVLGSATEAQLGGIIGPGGSIKSDVAQNTSKSMEALHRYGVAHEAQVKFRFIEGPAPTSPAESVTSEDVSTVLLSTGRIGQVELTLHKD